VGRDAGRASDKAETLGEDPEAMAALEARAKMARRKSGRIRGTKNNSSATLKAAKKPGKNSGHQYRDEPDPKGFANATSRSGDSRI